MITLITGLPGAGKTLYCVGRLLRDLVGTTIKSTDDHGQPVEVSRRILSNISGLLIDHDLIGADAGGGLADWFDWCKPGDVIVYDEVQRSWPPRPNGSKVPEFISALETHRHKGVDFIIMTQNPMLLDRNVIALVGRHLHVRRLGNVGAALVYEWDHCSRQLMYSKALKKSAFKYDKSVFKLYKSSELHTKQKVSIPPLLFVVGAAVVASLVLIPTFYKRLSSKTEQVATVPQSKPANGAGGIQGAAAGVGGRIASAAGVGGEPRGNGNAYDSAAFVPRVSYTPLSAPAYDQIRQVVSMPIIVGGMCFKGECRCYTQQGTDSGISSHSCKDWIDRRPFDPYTVQAQEVATAAPVSQSVQPGQPQTRTVPLPSGVSNPHLEARPAPLLQQARPHPRG